MYTHDANILVSRFSDEIAKFFARQYFSVYGNKAFEREDVVWTWDPPQQQALENLKKVVSSTPVLRYYSLQEEVTVQCDASLGAAVLQNGQPVAYASRALTPTETRYAQIEKELLPIVFACEQFEAYTYGRDTVQIETDHQPSEAIVQKPLHNTPSQLQHMLRNTT